MENKSAEALHLAFQTEGRARIVIVSGSMDPLLPIGATAEVVPCSFDDIKRFDLVLFADGGKVICHAVWGHSTLKNAKGETTLVTCGLANPAADSPVSASDVLGRVISHRLNSVQVAWAVLTRLFSRLISSPLFYFVLLTVTLWSRMVGAVNILFAICSAVAVFVFTKLTAKGQMVRGRLMALILALSPLSIRLAHAAQPWSAIEALTVFYIVAFWNFTQGERSRLSSTVAITLTFAVALKFLPRQFRFAIPLPTHWTMSEWMIVINPVAIFSAVMVAAWIYRLSFRLLNAAK